MTMATAPKPEDMMKDLKNSYDFLKALFDPSTQKGKDNKDNKTKQDFSATINSPQGGNFFQNMRILLGQMSPMPSIDTSLDLMDASLASTELTEMADKCDLSDPNRPTRLAERFLDLHHNEWRHCFSTVTGHFESKTSVIQMLLRTCLKIYSHCQMIASDDLNALKRAITLFSGDPDDTLMSQMKQRRRRNNQVDIDLSRVKTGLEEKMEDIFGPDLIKHPHVQAFWIKCLDICWQMVILNPPVVMDTEINKKGQQFDNCRYLSYTQSGDVIEFIVWPALYTQPGGDILSRGVAQGLVTTDSVGGKRRK